VPTQTLPPAAVPPARALPERLRAASPRPLATLAATAATAATAASAAPAGWLLGGPWAQQLAAVRALGPLWLRCGDGDAAWLCAGPVVGGADEPAARLPLSPARPAWRHALATARRRGDGPPARVLLGLDAAGGAALQLYLPPLQAGAAWAALLRRCGTPLTRRALDALGPALPAPAGACLAAAAAAAPRPRSAGRDALPPPAAPGCPPHPLPPDALQQLLALAGQAGVALQLQLLRPGLDDGPVWQGRVAPPRLDGARQRLQAPGLALSWREDRLGLLWLLREPGRQGLLHTLLLCDPQGHPWLRLGAARPAGRPEPCAWRTVVQTLGAAAQP